MAKKDSENTTDAALSSDLAYVDAIWKAADALRGQLACVCDDSMQCDRSGRRI